MEEREKRTECVFLHCTPSVKKELDQYTDDDVMKEKIIKEYIEREKDFMEESLKDLDENELRYKCSLVKIKNDFKGAQEAYSKEIDSIYNVAEESVRKLKESLKEPKEAIIKMTEEIRSFKDLLSKIPTYNINGISELLNVVERYSKMDEKSKNMVAKLIGNNE